MQDILYEVFEDPQIAKVWNCDMSVGCSTRWNKISTGRLLPVGKTLAAAILSRQKDGKWSVIKTHNKALPADAKDVEHFLLISD